MGYLPLRFAGVLQPDEFRMLMQSTGFGLSSAAIDEMLLAGDSHRTVAHC